ncbi:MAG: hypothetical protein IPG92_10530 [Flavobacteriales bacterium]|nr:hypothetical protein [Flavobacteriales bacterium]
MFTSIIGLFPEIIVLLASILYVRKAPGVDALLMVVEARSPWCCPSVG